ncbi:DUF4307 domain-containing protein [Demequina sp. NBRC 110053]|uniref:DUF4307 domain-containing protein n=1 Tax=Demequina sp. NBRC 110053 TaxID=1570342 RepID=UPI000A068785|nr:DUF4307 domain-containing protein [Demequina sp. NBRC 110053]
MSTAPDPIEDERSGARPRLSRKGWAWVLTGLVALTAVTAWIAYLVTDQPVRWQDVGFDIISPTQVEATFEIYFYDDEPVTCYLHAMNVQYAEVGVAEVDIDPADGSQQRLTVPISTVEEANTALVRGCGPVQ